ncbi:outer membrane protein transport protein [Chlamydiales bacterium]|nr:outer membrane protein transport protein [Chlamydiales bacterium]
MNRILQSVFLVFFTLSFEKSFATTASVKSIGMGGACMAFPLDAGVMAYNPAGIVDLENRFDIELYLPFNTSRASIKGNANPLVNKADKNTASLKISPESAAVYHVTPTLALGYIFYNEKELHNSYDNVFPLVGTSKLSFEYELQFFSPTIAWEFFKGQTFSIQLNYVTQRARLQGAENLAAGNGFFSTDPSFVTNKGYNYSTGYGVTFGWKGQINDRFSFGIAWKPKTHMKTLNQYKGFLAGQGSLDIPTIVRAGIAMKAFCNWTFAFDYQLLRYSEIPALNNSFTKRMSPPILALGADDGAGFGFQDQHFFRLGVNWDVSCKVSLRAGFRHANVVYSGKNVPPNILTNDVTVDFLTCGGTWRLLENAEINGFFAWGFNNKKKGPIEGGFPFGGGETTLKQQRIIFALSLGWLY